MFNKWSILLLVSIQSALAGYFTIEDLDNCARIAGNMTVFWQTNQPLIQPLKDSQELSEQQKQSLFGNKDPIVQGIIEEFKIQKTQALQDLHTSIIYTKANRTIIKEKLGRDTFNNLYGGLKLLEKLAEQFFK